MQTWPKRVINNNNTNILENIKNNLKSGKYKHK